MTVLNMAGGADFIRSIVAQGYSREHAELTAERWAREEAGLEQVIRRELNAAAELVTPGEPPTTAELRAYAAEHGLKCSERGRIPQAVLTHWQQSRNGQGANSKSRRRRR